MWQTFVCIMISPLPENVFKMTFEKKMQNLVPLEFEVKSKTYIVFPVTASYINFLY